MAVLDVAAVVDSSVLASLADPPPPPAGLVAVLDVAAVVDSSVLASLADPPPPPAVPVMVCPVGATSLLMAGYPHLFDGGNLFLGVPAQWVVASVAGKRMKFRSEETAESWVELVVIRAASEIGLASALPVASRDKWKAKKLESLAGYQDRMVQAAARLPSGSAGQVAILAEFAIVQEKIDSL